MSFSCICSSPPQLQPTNTTTNPSPLTRTHLPLLGKLLASKFFFLMWDLGHFYFFTHRAVVLVGSLLSQSLSPFTFPSLNYVIPVFHFILASRSSLINKPMTWWEGMFFSILYQIFVCEFLPTIGPFFSSVLCHQTTSLSSCDLNIEAL